MIVLKADKELNLTFQKLIKMMDAPVEEGMMLPEAARPPRQSFLEGPSTVFWVAVVEWTVVIRPSVMPQLSCSTLAMGARQLVVQEALETKFMLES